MPASDFQITIDIQLQNFNFPRKCLVLVSNNIKIIDDLSNHIKKLFRLKNELFLFRCDEFLPPLESIDIIKAGDLIKVTTPDEFFASECYSSTNGSEKACSEASEPPNKGIKRDRRRRSKSSEYAEFNEELVPMPEEVATETPDASSEINEPKRKRKRSHKKGRSEETQESEAFKTGFKDAEFNEELVPMPEEVATETHQDSIELPLKKKRKRKHKQNKKNPLSTAEPEPEALCSVSESHHSSKSSQVNVSDELEVGSLEISPEHSTSELVTEDNPPDQDNIEVPKKKKRKRKHKKSKKNPHSTAEPEPEALCSVLESRHSSRSSHVLFSDELEAGSPENSPEHFSAELVTEDNPPEKACSEASEPPNKGIKRDRRRRSKSSEYAEFNEELVPMPEEVATETQLEVGSPEILPKDSSEEFPTEGLEIYSPEKSPEGSRTDSITKCKSPGLEFCPPDKSPEGSPTESVPEDKSLGLEVCSPEKSPHGSPTDSISEGLEIRSPEKSPEVSRTDSVTNDNSPELEVEDKSPHGSPSECVAEDNSDKPTENKGLLKSHNKNKVRKRTMSVVYKRTLMQTLPPQLLGLKEKDSPSLLVNIEKKPSSRVVQIKPKKSVNNPVQVRPKVGEYLLFKKIKIGPNYCPETSKEICGKVLSLDENAVEFKIIYGKEEWDLPEGKLSLGTQDSLLCSVKLTWNELIEPQLKQGPPNKGVIILKRNMN